MKKNMDGETGEFSVEHVSMRAVSRDVVNLSMAGTRKSRGSNGSTDYPWRTIDPLNPKRNCHDSPIAPPPPPSPRLPIVPSAKNFADLLIILDPSLPWLLSSEHRFPFGPNPKRVRPFVPTLETPCTCVFYTYTRNV